MKWRLPRIRLQGRTACDCLTSNLWLLNFGPRLIPKLLLVLANTVIPLSMSESELLYDAQFTANQFVLAPVPSRLTAGVSFRQLNPCVHSPSYERTCLSFTITAGSVQHNHSRVANPTGLVIVLSCIRFEIPPTCRARSLYVYPPGTGSPSCTPGHRVPVSSPTTLKATVKVSVLTALWHGSHTILVSDLVFVATGVYGAVA
jgi:hypothetical protein